MKPHCLKPLNFSSLSARLILAAALIMFNTRSIYAQNLVVNGDFAGGSSSGWNTNNSIEVNPQTTYGGPSSSIYVTEIDVERSITQQVCILPGLSYTFSYQVTRRPQSGTPSNPGILVKVTGTSSNTNYVQSTQTYTNTSWSAQTIKFTVTIPANSSDKKVNIQFTPSNNTSTYGVLVWDIQFGPSVVNPVAISGPTTSGVNTLNNFAVTNAPASASYSWTFSSDANYSTSIGATPSGVTWASIGVKNVTVALSNGTCTMATYSKTVTISQTLAVSWVGFTGAMSDGEAQLTWISGQESNGKYFVIQRSSDGIHFDSVGVVASRNAATNATYQYTDKNMPAGHVYYRIFHVDLDNAASFSKIIALDNKTAAGSDVHIYPNPAAAVLNYDITSAQDSKIYIQVFSPSGILMSSGQAQLSAGANHNTINIGGLNKGNYFLKIVSAHGSQLHTQTFMKM